jgi:serine/threonine protein kinase
MSSISKPKKVGIYTIGEMIGRGAIGCVYKGINSETGGMVAIK